jgi:hypothetical protein
MHGLAVLVGRAGLVGLAVPLGQRWGRRRGSGTLALVLADSMAPVLADSMALVLADSLTLALELERASALELGVAMVVA